MEKSDVVITKKRIKNIYIKVFPDGRVEVHAPLKTSKEYIDRFIDTKWEWVQSKLPKNSKKPCEYADGDVLYIFGDPYTVSVADVKKAEVCANTVILPKEPQNRKAAYYELLYDCFMKRLPEISASAEKRVGRYHKGEYRIKPLKSRWGSCNVKSASITLSLNLAKYPEICADGVLTHELCHLIEASHNRKFHELVEKFALDYKKCDDLLRDHFYEE